MLRTSLIVILMLILAACADNAVRKKVEDLDYAIDNYAYALRWQRKNDAVAYHVRPDGSKPVIDTSMLDVVRITGFNITEKTVNPEITGADIAGEFDYIHNEFGTLRKIKFTQKWWYEPESKKWFLDSEFPQFK